MTYYKLENIEKSFGNNKILENISFSLNKGDIISFVGKSGVGKTTLFDILAGFENPTNGKIFLNEKDITKEKKNISYMMQKSLLLEHLTVLQNVCLPLKLQKIDKKNAIKICEDILEKFELLEHKNKYPNQISGGMKQRLSFLRAYLKKADLMLLDEPFSALDSITKHYMHSWFESVIKKRENTIIFITHDIKEALKLSDKIFVLSGKPAKIVYSLDIKNKSLIEDTDLFNKYYNEILEYIGDI